MIVGFFDCTFLFATFLPMISIFSRGGALRFAAFFLMLVALSVSCGSSEEGQGTSFGARFLESQNTSLEAPGYASDPRIVLSGTVGTSYTVTVTEGGSWCWTSRNTHATSRSGSLVTTADVVYLYLAENDSGAARTATVRVAFDGGLEFDLTLSQPEYSIPAVMDHPWAELPAYKSIDNCTYVTHYAPISSTQPKARNFTICYDRSKRIALWVAYPIHACYMQNYIRSDAWDFDPEIPEADQADLRSGSYRGGGVRGHQCMSNHRSVPYSTLLNEQTFYSTNIMPQESAFNGGSWLKMEETASAMGKSCADTLYTVTGNYGVRSWSTDRSGTKVAMPEYCWKVLLRTKNGNTRKLIDEIHDASELIAIGFWAENSSASADGLAEYTTSVAEIEQKTGYKFFPMLDEAIAADVKAQHNPTAWGITE